MKKEIVLSGCSQMANYIDYHNRNNEWGNHYYPVYDKVQDKYISKKWENIDPWPIPVEILAKKYDMIPVDLAYPGSGNKQIYQKLLDYVYLNHKNIGLVVACWSSFSRIDFDTKEEVIGSKKRPGPDYDSNRYWQTLTFNDYENTTRNKEILYFRTDEPYEIWKSLYYYGTIFPEKDIDDFFRYSVTLDLICKEYNIECVQCASIRTEAINNSSKLLKYFINHPMYYKINEMNFYGWPMYKSLGGDCTYSCMVGHCINEYDPHPNKIGHELIANQLINFIEERNIL